MNKQTRSKYADYIARCIREATVTTGLQWPDDTILCVKTYSELAEIDEIIGIKIFVMDMPSSYDFFVAFPAENVDCYELQKAFLDNVECFEFS